MLLIGSQAANLRGYTLRPIASDLDLICTIKEYEQLLSVLNKDPSTRPDSAYPIQGAKKMVVFKKDTTPTEFEIAWPDSTAEKLMWLVEKDSKTKPVDQASPISTVTKILLPSLNVLFSLKASHRYLKNSPAFLKTMEDYNGMKDMGCKIPPEYAEWFKEREKETYNYGHPKLNQDKEGFFSGDGVPYIYDHDSIHEAMAIYGIPAYKLFKKDNEEVAVDKKKWDTLPYDYKLASVLEETYVLALERSQIPLVSHPKRPPPSTSFLKSLEKVCTSITSGWWREFAYDNYTNVKNGYNSEYVERFWIAVANGKVKKLTSEPKPARM